MHQLALMQNFGGVTNLILLHE